MPEDIRKVIDRLKEDIATIENWGSSYWNKSLHEKTHLKLAAKMLKNDADIVASS